LPAELHLHRHDGEIPVVKGKPRREGAEEITASCLEPHRQRRVVDMAAAVRFRDARRNRSQGRVLGKAHCGPHPFRKILHTYSFTVNDPVKLSFLLFSRISSPPDKLE